MKKLLVVDENSAFGDLLAKMFGESIEVLKATEGGDGVRKAIDARPDVILLDAMASHGGVEVLRRLQSAEETESIPVIILTGPYFERGMQRVLQREPNVASFLDKTMPVALIIGQVEQALDDIGR